MACPAHERGLTATGLLLFTRILPRKDTRILSYKHGVGAGIRIQAEHRDLPLLSDVCLTERKKNIVTRSACVVIFTFERAVAPGGQPWHMSKHESQEDARKHTRLRGGGWSKTVCWTHGRDMIGPGRRSTYQDDCIDFQVLFFSNFLFLLFRSFDLCC